MISTENDDTSESAIRIDAGGGATGNLATLEALFDRGDDAVWGGTPARQRDLRSKGRRTLQRLLAAALASLRERGYHETRIDDVATRAGSSHGTFYRYFDGKDDLLDALVRACRAHAIDVAATLPPAADDSSLGDWMHGLCGFLTLHRPVLDACRTRTAPATVPDAGVETVLGPLEEALAERLDEILRDAPRSRAAAVAMVGACDELTRRHTEEEAAEVMRGLLHRLTVGIDRSMDVRHRGD